MEPFTALSVASAGLSLFGGFSAKKKAKKAAKVQKEINLASLAETERQLGRAEESVIGQNMLALAAAGVTVPDKPSRAIESINDPRLGSTGPEYAPYDFGGGSAGLFLTDVSREFRITRDVAREQTRLQNKYAEQTGQNAGDLAVLGGINDALRSAIMAFGR